MDIRLNKNGIYMLFRVLDDGAVRLLHFSNREYEKELSEKEINEAVAFELQLAGDLQYGAHGAKHTGTGSGREMRYVSHFLSDSEFTLTLESKKVRAVLHYLFYDGVCGVRTYSEIKNISDEPIGVTYISSFSLFGMDGGENGELFIPTNTWSCEADWKRYALKDLGAECLTDQSTKRIFMSNSGTWSAKEHLPMVAYSDCACTYMWQIENNGSWNWEVGDLNKRIYVKLSGPSENENHWYKELKPGGEFKSVPAAVCLGYGFDSALSSLTAYRRQIVRPFSADESLPVIFNDYMNCLWADPTEEKMMPVIDKAAEAGAEFYVMDAGWYADGNWWDTVGEWKENKDRFPNGIKKVFDYIRFKGMTPGIWLEIEVVGINSPMLKQLDDSFFFMRHGRRVIDNGRYQFDFRNEKVRAFADSVIDRVVNEYGAGYIKMDYNIDAGIGTETNADSFGDGLLEHNRAYLAWIDSVSARYPDLIIENCSSGGLRMDYAMLAHHALQSVSDRTDYCDNAVISAAAPTAVLPEQGAIWTYPMAKETENITAFNMVNALLMRMHLSGEIAGLSKRQFEIVKKGVACYQETKKYIRGLTPFYPLGLPKYSDEFLCCGFESKDKTFIKIWRRGTADEKKTCFIPLENCRAANILFSDDRCTADVTDGGLTVGFANKISAALIEIEK